MVSSPGYDLYTGLETAELRYHPHIQYGLTPFQFLPKKAMLENKFKVDFSDTDWVGTRSGPKQPGINIRFKESREELKEWIQTINQTVDIPHEIGFSYRYKSSALSSSLDGAFSLSDRLTGEYFFEVEMGSTPIETFLEAGRLYMDADYEHSKYAVYIWVEGEKAGMFEKDVFLVFGPVRGLLRERSLIPSHVEI